MNVLKTVLKIIIIAAGIALLSGFIWLGFQIAVFLGWINLNK